MATITLQYDGRNSIFSHLLNAFIQAGAKIVEQKTRAKSQTNDFDIVAEHLYGKRKNG